MLIHNSMTLQAATRWLSVQLERLQDALNALHLTVGVDRPAHGGSAVGDILEASTLNLLRLLHEARRAATQARKAVSLAPDFPRARNALSICQKRIQSAE